MTAPVVVFAVGNPSRGDDAIGPVICGRLEKWLENEGLADQFELIEDFQLQIEHAMDLQGRQLALFIDAGADLVVFHATHLARAWGVSDLFVGLTVVAIATSLPQLAMALRAAAANRGDEVVLGVLGSNLINLTLILGVTALLSPLEVPASLVRLEIPAVIAFGLVLYPMLRGDLDLRRSEGALLVLSFLGLTAFQVWLVRA